MIRAARVIPFPRARVKSDFGTGPQLAQVAAFVAAEVNRRQMLGDKRDQDEIGTAVLAEVGMPKLGNTLYKLCRRAKAREASLARAAHR